MQCGLELLSTLPRVLETGAKQTCARISFQNPKFAFELRLQLEGGGESCLRSLKKYTASLANAP